MQILGAIDRVLQVFKPKTEMPNVDLNSSSSKTNRTSGIKVSNLEAPGQEFQLPKTNYDNFDTFFFLSLFICLFIYSANHIMVTKTPKPPKLET